MKEANSVFDVFGRRIFCFSYCGETFEITVEESGGSFDDREMKFDCCLMRGVTKLKEVCKEKCTKTGVKLILNV